jgi:hypothetical protein
MDGVLLKASNKTNPNKEEQTMKLRSAWLIILASTLLWSGDMSYQASPQVQGRDVTVDKDDQMTIIDCNATAVLVSGDDNKITLKGQCSKLTVTGDDNQVTGATVNEVTVSGDDNTISVDAVAKITTTGDDNKVRWKAGIAGKRPEVSNTGSDNELKEGDE